MVAASRAVAPSKSRTPAPEAAAADHHWGQRVVAAVALPRAQVPPPEQAERCTVAGSADAGCPATEHAPVPRQRDVGEGGGDAGAGAAVVAWMVEAGAAEDDVAETVVAAAAGAPSSRGDVARGSGSVVAAPAVADAAADPGSPTGWLGWWQGRRFGIRWK